MGLVGIGVTASGDTDGGLRAWRRWWAPFGLRRWPVLRWLIRHIAGGLLSLLAASILIFIAASVLPGDPGAILLGHGATLQAIHATDARLGLNHSLVFRYFSWLGGLLHGDLGKSGVAVAQGASGTAAEVWPLIQGRLGNTATLALVTVVLLIPLSLGLGVIAAVRAGRLTDHVISAATVAMVSLPEFVVGTILIVIFFVVLHLLPPVSLVAPGQTALAHPNILVLPVATLLAVSLGWTVRFVRFGTIETLDSDYVRFAELNGIARWRVLRRYALRNALVPSIQMFAIVIQYLFGGVIVTEVVFGFPGLGQGLVNATLAHDTPEVQAIAMIFAAIYVTILIFADFLVVILIPRLRTQM